MYCLSNHTSNIRNNHKTAIGIQFNNYKHNVSQLKISTSEQILDGTQHRLLLREEFRINKLTTEYPYLSKYLNTFISHWYSFWLPCHSLITNDFMHYILSIPFMKSGSFMWYITLLWVSHFASRWKLPVLYPGHVFTVYARRRHMRFKESISAVIRTKNTLINNYFVPILLHCVCELVLSMSKVSQCTSNRAVHIKAFNVTTLN